MKVLVLDRYTEKSLSLLNNKDFSVTRVSGTQIPKEHLTDTEALLVRSRTVISADLLKKMPELKAVVTATSGFDHIDWQACREKNVAAFYTPEANAPAAAEHALFLILASLRQFRKVQKIQDKELWKDQLSNGNNLYDQSVGLIGMGRVAKQLAHLLKAFNCHIQFYDPFVSFETAEKLGLHKTDITELLKTSDIVSLHLPLTKKTRNLMHANNIQEMSSEAILINTSRGEVVCEASLINALSENQLAGAGLDVFAHEPLPKDSKLRQLDNVVMSPHIGAMTTQALERASEQAVHRLIEFTNKPNFDDALPHGIPWLE